MTRRASRTWRCTRGLGGHGQQRAQPAGPGQRPHPAARAGRDLDARLRPERVGPAPAQRLQPHPRVRPARPAQPVLRRRRPGGRGGGAGCGHGAVPLQQRGGPGPRGRVPRHPAGAAGPRRAHHAGRRTTPSGCGSMPELGVPVVLLDRMAGDPTDVVQRLGRRRRGRRPRGHPPAGAGTHADRLRRRAALDRPGRRPAPGRAAGLRAGRVAGRPARRAGDRRAHRGRGAPGRASGCSGCRPGGGRPPCSAPTTCWRSASCSR